MKQGDTALREVCRGPNVRERIWKVPKRRAKPVNNNLVRHYGPVKADTPVNTLRSRIEALDAFAAKNTLVSLKRVADPN